MKTNNKYTITTFNEYELYHIKSEIDFISTELRDNMEYLTPEQPDYYETQDNIEILERVILLLDELVHLQ